jgi:hypothetical protein
MDPLPFGRIEYSIVLSGSAKLRGDFSLNWRGATKGGKMGKQGGNGLQVCGGATRV